MSNKNNDDLKYQASENTLGLNPVVGLRGKDLLASARMVLTQAIKQPIHSVKHVAHFGVELKNVIFGDVRNLVENRIGKQPLPAHPETQPQLRNRPRRFRPARIVTRQRRQMPLVIEAWQRHVGLRLQIDRLDPALAAAVALPSPALSALTSR